MFIKMNRGRTRFSVAATDSVRGIYGIVPNSSFASGFGDSAIWRQEAPLHTQSSVASVSCRSPHNTGSVLWVWVRAYSKALAVVACSSLTASILWAVWPILGISWRWSCVSRQTHPFWWWHNNAWTPKRWRYQVFPCLVWLCALWQICRIQSLWFCPLQAQDIIWQSGLAL